MPLDQAHAVDWSQWSQASTGRASSVTKHVMEGTTALWLQGRNLGRGSRNRRSSRTGFEDLNPPRIIVAAATCWACSADL